MSGLNSVKSKISRAASSIRKNYDDIYWWRDNLLYNFLKLFDKNDGNYILDSGCKWDNLIILDGCRYDIFERVFFDRRMKGILESRSSRGTWTVEFLIENFRDRDARDIIYITGNPYVDKYLDGIFYKIISVWKDGWDFRYNTVNPYIMYKYSLSILERYPDKKLIIHFMQPHHPFFTLKVNDDLMNKIRESVLYNQSFKRSFSKKILEIHSIEMYSRLTIPQIIQAYTENLKLVMPYVEALLNVLPGRTVITSDHGESFGDKIHPLLPIRFYGHGFTRLSSLTHVPWLIVTEDLKRPYRDSKILKKEIMMIERKYGFKSNVEKAKVGRSIKSLIKKGVF